MASGKIEDDLRWLHRGVHRTRVLKQIAELESSTTVADQVTTLTAINLDPGSSAYANGRLAILGLLERGFVVNDAPKKRQYDLRVNWDQIRIYSDWLEESGRERLDVEALEPR